MRRRTRTSRPGVSQAGTARIRSGAGKSRRSRIDPLQVLSGLEWRSGDPVGFRDRDLGPARLEARGVYSIRIADPEAFRRAFEGNGTRESIRTRLEERIVTRFDDLLKARLNTIRDLPVLYNELATEMRLEIKEDFSRWGIHLIDFFVTSVVPTADFQKVLNAQKRAAPAHSTAGTPPPARPGGGGKETASPPRYGQGDGNGFVIPDALMREGERCPHCGSTRRTEPCPRCGSSVSETARYCPGCGTPRSSN